MVEQSILEMNHKKCRSQVGLDFLGLRLWCEQFSDNDQSKDEISTSPREVGGWETLNRRMLGCNQCDLSKTRHTVVIGEGPLSSRLMVIGEAPGAEEDLRGRPFVGRAGVLLDNIFSAVGLSREEIYITNIVKCRPPRNRNPSLIEIVACQDYLHTQIRMISPVLIIALGKVAAQSLLGNQGSMQEMAGQLYECRLAEVAYPLMVTYHPAYLLRRPKEKKKAWRDWQRIREKLSEETYGKK